MTVEASKPVSREQYTGPDNYTFNFTIFSVDELIITYIDPEGTPLILRNGFDYTITNFDENGGVINITYQASTNTGIVDIRRRLPIVQETDYVNSSAFDMNILESDFDKIIMIMQDIDNKVAEQLSPFVSRSDWQTTTHYFVGDVVTAPDESMYQCIVEHQSTQFTDDLNDGKWIILFDVSILKGYEQDAENSMNSAQQYRNEAEGFKDQASSIRNDCESYRNESEHFRNQAGTSATESSNSANLSAQFASQADTSRYEAEHFKNEAYNYSNTSKEYAYGNPPEGSAKYWAQQAGAVVAGTAPNKVINGNFDVWSYGSSQTTNGFHSADRWYFNMEGTGGMSRTISKRTPMNYNTNEIPPLCVTHYLEDIISLGTEVADDHYVVMSQRILDAKQFSGKKIYLQMYLNTDTACSISISLDIEHNIYDDAYWHRVVDGARIITLNNVNTWEEHTVTFQIPTIDYDLQTLNCLRLKIWRSAGSDFDSLTGGLGKQPNGYLNMSAIRLYISEFPRECEIRTADAEETLCKSYKYDLNTTRTVGVASSTTHVVTQKYIHPVPMVGYPITSTVDPSLIYYGDTRIDNGEYGKYNDKNGVCFIFKQTGSAPAGAGIYLMYGNYRVSAEPLINMGVN
jgi:hypothetical protein